MVTTGRKNSHIAMDRIGLIAETGVFLFYLCEAARKRGVSVVAVAIRGETSSQIGRMADTVHWLSLGEFERVYDIFHAENISKVVMAGQISPRSLFSRQVRENKAIQELLNSIIDRRANTIFGAIAKRLAEKGITLIDSTTFLQPFVPQPGVLTSRKPSESEWLDIRCRHGSGTKGGRS